MTALMEKMLSHCVPSSKLGLAQYFSLNGFHGSGIRVASIIKTMQMKQTVDKVEAQLARERGPESTGVPPRHFRADKDLAVLKRNHVSRSGFIHELSVDRRDFSIGDDQNRDFRRLLKVGRHFSRDTQAKLDGSGCEILKICKINADLPLKIADNNARKAAFHFDRRIRSICLSSS
jgi:hypothetical protein